MNKRLIALPIIMALAMPTAVQAKPQPHLISYADADCNMTSYLIINAQERLKTQPTVVTKKKNKVKSTKEETISQIDLNLLAHLIYAESGNLGEQAMIYTGSVVLNRVKYHRYFPDTIREVIYQRGQYACTWDGHINLEPSITAYNVADLLLRHGSHLPENVVFQAEFKQGDGVYAQIGNTYYCYLKK